MTRHFAACIWCGLKIDTPGLDESFELLSEHIMHCENGPVNTCITVLKQHANPETTEKAKEAIRCRLMR